MTGYSSIGEIARETGASVQTIRYYEAKGLLPKPPRTEGGQRRYGSQHRARLAFIRHARELGFSLDSIGELIRYSDRKDVPCGPVDRIARRQLTEVDRRIERLQRLRTALAAMVADCEGGNVASCRILGALERLDVGASHAKDA